MVGRRAGWLFLGGQSDRREDDLLRRLLRDPSDSWDEILMRYVKVLAVVVCLATIGLIYSDKVPSIMANDRPDIGIVEAEQCPEDKGDILVVYSATWCGPCAILRPNWATLRGQGYKVVYIDVDQPYKHIGNWDYQTKEIVEKAMEKRPKSVPTMRYYNTDSGRFLEKQVTGLHSLKTIKEALWKPSSSTGLVPELSR